MLSGKNTVRRLNQSKIRSLITATSTNSSFLEEKGANVQEKSTNHDTLNFSESSTPELSTVYSHLTV